MYLLRIAGISLFSMNLWFNPRSPFFQRSKSRRSKWRGWRVSWSPLRVRLRLFNEIWSLVTVITRKIKRDDFWMIRKRYIAHVSFADGFRASWKKNWGKLTKRSRKQQENWKKWILNTQYDSLLLTTAIRKWRRNIMNCYDSRKRFNLL